jgi:uncharacterized protein
VMLFLQGKMVTLLSMLFGVGLAMQARQAQASGRQFAPYYRRRMFILFLIGLAHALLLFHFDILTSYAVAGLIALLFLRVSDRALLRVAAVCFAWCSGLMLLFMVLTTFIIPSLDAPAEKSTPAAVVTQPVETPAAASPPPEPTSMVEKFFSEENETRVFREGRFREMVFHRAIYLAIVVILFWVESGWYILACILAGIWLARRGVFEHVDSHRLLFHRFTIFGLALGAPLHAAAMAAYLHDPEGTLSLCLVVLGLLPLALFYLSLLTRWAESDRAQWLQNHLRAVGRMSLTNYLMQSLVCGFVFYGYGFGLYGRLDRTALFGIVLAIWIMLMLLSRWWLQRFQMGPAEWLWRSLSDRKRQARAHHA